MELWTNVGFFFNKCWFYQQKNLHLLKYELNFWNFNKCRFFYILAPKKLTFVERNQHLLTFLVNQHLLKKTNICWNKQTFDKNQHLLKKTNICWTFQKNLHLLKKNLVSFSIWETIVSFLPYVYIGVKRSTTLCIQYFPKECYYFCRKTIFGSIFTHNLQQKASVIPQFPFT